MVVWEDGWQEEEGGPKVFKIPQKKEIRNGRCKNLEPDRKESKVKIPIEGLRPEEWTVLVYLGGRGPWKKVIHLQLNEKPPKGDWSRHPCCATVCSEEWMFEKNNQSGEIWTLSPLRKESYGESLLLSWTDFPVDLITLI